MSRFLFPSHLLMSSPCSFRYPTLASFFWVFEYSLEKLESGNLRMWHWLFCVPFAVEKIVPEGMRPLLIFVGFLSTSSWKIWIWEFGTGYFFIFFVSFAVEIGLSGTRVTRPLQVFLSFWVLVKRFENWKFGNMALAIFCACLLLCKLFFQVWDLCKIRRHPSKLMRGSARRQNSKKGWARQRGKLWGVSRYLTQIFMGFCGFFSIS